MKACVCGHSQADHIYHEGACRPGFVCPADCRSFRPVPSPSGAIVAAHGRMVAWAEAHPEADTQGITPEEWDGLACAALGLERPY